jgi:predicted nucleic acid-binding Zn ribbon protein
MPFCPECGKPVTARAKFCRNCGASQLEEVSLSPAPVPVAQEPNTPACSACGAPLAPDEKFCGTCGAKTGAAPVAMVAPVAPPVVAPPAAVPVPSPAAAAPVSPPVSAPVSGGVRTCSACGNVIKPGDKFCSKCLVIVKDNIPAAAVPVPPPVSAPAPAAVPVSGGVRTCTACGNVIKPGDKFCSKCLVIVKDNIPAAAVPVPPPVSAPAPAAVPVSGGVRTCSACGNVIKPGDKFCSKCLVIVKDNPPAATSVPSPLPAAPAGASPYTCAACGKPIDAMEKFCGACGAPAVAARAQPASTPPAGTVAPEKTCGKCGAVVSGTTKFCGACGAPVGAAAPAASPAPVPGGEQVIGVIANARRKKLLTYDTYNLIITDRRMIIASLNPALLNAAVAEAQAKAKAEGKGFFGVWGDQLAASFQFARRYETMSPDAALAETPGNTAIENTAITALDLKLYNDDDNSTYSEFGLTIKSSTGKNEFRIGEDDRFINTLKTAYGDRVHMPFGYFRAGGMKIKFF